MVSGRGIKPKRARKFLKDVYKEDEKEFLFNDASSKESFVSETRFSAG